MPRRLVTETIPDPPEIKPEPITAKPLTAPAVTSQTIVSPVVGMSGQDPETWLAIKVFGSRPTSLVLSEVNKCTLPSRIPKPSWRPQGEGQSEESHWLFIVNMDGHERELPVLTPGGKFSLALTKLAYYTRAKKVTIDVCTYNLRVHVPQELVDGAIRQMR